MTKFKIGILTLFLGVPIFLCAQKLSEADSIAYDKLTTTAEESFYNDPMVAFNNYSEAIQKALYHQKLYDCLYLSTKKAECAVYHFEYDSAYQFLNAHDVLFDQIAQKLDSSEQYILPRHSTDWLYYLNRIGDDREVISRAKKLIQKIQIEEFGGIYGPYHLTVAQNYLGVALKKLGRLQEAEQVFLEGIEKSIELEDWPQRNAFYKQLGDVYAQQNLIGQSNQYFKKAIATNLRNYNKDPSNRLAARLTSIYQAISKNYIHSNQPDSALYFVQQIGPLIEQDSFLYIPYLVELAESEITKKNWIAAKNWLNEALRYSSSNSDKNPSQSILLQKLAEISRLQNNVAGAQQFINKAIKAATSNGDFLDLNRGVEILFEEFQILAAGQNPGSLDQALEKIIETTDLINDIRLRATTDEDRNFLISKALPIYDQAIELLIDPEINEATDRESIAFGLMEETKAINLLGAMRGISENENNLGLGDQQKLALAKKKWDDTKNALDEGGRSNQVDSMQKELLFNRGNYLKLIREQRENSPKEYISRYTIDTSTFENIISALDSDDASLISFIWTKSQLFALYIDGQHQQLYPCGEVQELSSLCHQFKERIQDTKQPFDKGNAHNLFLKLFSPIAHLLKEKMIIIPGGQLYHIPFEVLVKNTDARKNDFLVNHHAITYNYSAAIWESNRNSKHIDKGLDMLSFAPSFSENNAMAINTRESLEPLLFNELEVNSLSNWMHNNVHIGQDASKQSFLKNAENFSSIHLATHAQAFDQNPGQSFLAFTGASERNTSNRLYLSDIYALPLKAELVTLSACETGLGPIQAGEGVVSLARAFQYAGADALLTSLWKVNDETTSQLMNSFYKNISKGKSKSESLRQAKSEYLNQLNKDNLHPAYWAGFVLYGDDEPMTTNKSTFWLMMLSLSLIGAFLFAFILKKRSKLSN